MGPFDRLELDLLELDLLELWIPVQETTSMKLHTLDSEAGECWNTVSIFLLGIWAWVR